MINFHCIKFQIHNSLCDCFTKSQRPNEYSEINATRTLSTPEVNHLGLIIHSLQNPASKYMKKSFCKKLQLGVKVKLFCRGCCCCCWSFFFFLIFQNINLLIQHFHPVQEAIFLFIAVCFLSKIIHSEKLQTTFFFGNMEKTA